MIKGPEQLWEKFNAWMKRNSVPVKGKNRFFKGKAIIIHGPRQSGKTTLVERLTEDYQETALWLNGDEPDVREMLSGITSTRLKAIFGKKPCNRDRWSAEDS